MEGDAVSDLYIACSKWKETVNCFGEGNAARLALKDFVNSGEFKEQCFCDCIKDGEIVTVKVFKKITKGESSYYDDILQEENWEFCLGDEVESYEVEFNTSI